MREHLAYDHALGREDAHLQELDDSGVVQPHVPATSIREHEGGKHAESVLYDSPFLIVEVSLLTQECPYHEKEFL